MVNYFHSNFIPISYIILNLISFTLISNATNNISEGQLLKDGETLVSHNGTFKFGFFSPINSSLRYVGIWYSDISVDNIIWVANRNSPISEKKGSLIVRNDGNLIIFDGYGRNIWSSDTKVSSKFHKLILHHDGNLEISGFNFVGGNNITCWQSFDYPSDTFLPGVKVAVNAKVGEVKFLYSWKSRNDPSIGSYSLGIDPRVSPQFVIWEGSKRRWRSGHWDGLKFIGLPTMHSFYSHGVKLSSIDASGNMYFTYSPLNMSILFKFKLFWDGYQKALVWDNGGNEWKVYQSAPYGECDLYNKCGVNGLCGKETNSSCDCIRGFKPTDVDEWGKGNYSGGCIRKTKWDCKWNSRFLEVYNVKLPDFADQKNVLDETGCGNLCLMNCSCMAYSFVSSIGCMTWTGDLFDIQHFPEGGNNLHVRVAFSDIGQKVSFPIAKVAGFLLTITLSVCACNLCLHIGFVLKLWKAKRRTIDGMTTGLRNDEEFSEATSGSSEILGENEPDASFLDYNLVVAATNVFSDRNKLGQGGFGPVYKGVLPGGQEIAVKKLSIKYGQGIEEFENEIMLMAQLQHRNLVRVLGACMLGEEKMLIYEYMPNKSLDSFIFDPVKRKQLDWRKRFTIIEGIARGLLYLHRDAGCSIIHKDLKAGNILLDQEMNPKISDFGMSRMFRGDQDQSTTDRRIGNGYMAPECAMEGFFCERSDVYSFGVLLLEIITGHRNARFQFGEHVNLVEYAWELWSEGRTTKLIDSSIGNSYPSNEITRRVHIAMLCVQDSAVDRPTMSQVVLWLETDTLPLPNPSKPTLTYKYYSSRFFIDIDFKCL